MGHTAFGMLLVPLVFWFTLIFLAMAAVHLLFSAMARLARRSPRTGPPRPRTAPRRLAPIPFGQPS